MCSQNLKRSGKSACSLEGDGNQAQWDADKCPDGGEGGKKAGQDQGAGIGFHRIPPNCKLN